MGNKEYIERGALLKTPPFTKYGGMSSEYAEGYLDCIDAAKEMLAKGYRKQEWISVEERLPSDEEQRDEYGELVPFLVCEKDTTYPYRAFYDGKEWGDGLMRIRGITHWMPLPEPPKGE